MKKIQLTTLGCKVNQYESASFHSSFEKRGHLIVSSDREANIIIINTCSVTGKAGAQSRQAIRRALRTNPEAKVIITGCYSQIADTDILQMEEILGRSVALVGNGDKHLLVDLALQDSLTPAALTDDIAGKKTISPLPVQTTTSRTRAYLRIQDGCNAFCSYCIVPYTRGRSRSLEVDEVLTQARTYAELGYREVVITGIHVGYYGADLATNVDLAELIDLLCRETPAVRYRLSSIEPTEISPKIIDVINKNDNFMPHLHIPLQSGCDAILLRMNRRYSTSQFTETLGLCHDSIEDLAVGIDVLAGFPGETEAYFQDTYDYLQSLAFTYLHVFPYSSRPGTPAANFTGHVEKKTKNERVNLLRNLSAAKRNTYYSRFTGHTRPVLVETKKTPAGRLKGFTDNYIPVEFTGEDSLQNRVVNVKIESLNGSTTIGTLIHHDHEG